jgi:integrase
MRRRGNGEGSTYKLATGKWRSEIRLTIGGRSVRVRATGETMTKAVQARKAREKEAQARAGIIESETTVGEWIEHWIATSNVRETTKASRRCCMGKMLEAIGQRPLQALTPEDIRNALDRMKRDGVGTRSIQVGYESLSASLNVAVRSDLIPSNPCAKIGKPKHIKTPYHAPDAEEADRLIEAARPGRERALIATVLELGLRIGEALALRWCDVNVDEGVLSVNATLSNKGERVEPKTDSSVRVLAIPSRSVALLRDLRSAEPAGLDLSSFVFRTDEGRPLDRHNVRRDLHKVCDRAGVPRVRIHALRSTSLSLRLSQGASYEDVARVAGHKNSRMLVTTYGRPMQGDRRMADLMDAVWKNGPQMAPKWLSTPIPAGGPKQKNPRGYAGFPNLEDRRLELLTPCMPCKCSTN